MCVDDHKPLWNELRDKILIAFYECGRWTGFVKPSVCIILVVLVYRESAKIYTGPKIVRVFRRLKNTLWTNGLSCINITPTREVASRRHALLAYQDVYEWIYCKMTGKRVCGIYGKVLKFGVAKSDNIFSTSTRISIPLKALNTLHIDPSFCPITTYR